MGDEPRHILVTISARLLCIFWHHIETGIVRCMNKIYALKVMNMLWTNKCCYCNECVYATKVQCGFVNDLFHGMIEITVM